MNAWSITIPVNTPLYDKTLVDLEKELQESTYKVCAVVGTKVNPEPILAHAII